MVSAAVVPSKTDAVLALVNEGALLVGCVVVVVVVVVVVLELLLPVLGELPLPLPPELAEPPPPPPPQDPSRTEIHRKHIILEPFIGSARISQKF